MQKERVCLFLNRGNVIGSSIRTVLKCGKAFGRSQSTGKAFSLKHQPDAESDLTTQRLHLIKNIAAKVLSLHGHEVSDEESSGASKYMFTSKSEGSVSEGYQKYICGVVKNSRLNSKEVSLSWQQYVEHKVKQLAELNEHKLNGDEEDGINDAFLRNLASAVITFELISVRPSRSVVIENDSRSVTNMKGLFGVVDVIIENSYKLRLFSLVDDAMR